MNAHILSENEYAPYYSNYIKAIENLDFFETLETSLNEAIAFLEAIPNEKLKYRYAKEKWTIKEILQHIIDTERILSYRALRFSRNDATDLPGFDENWYVIHSNANQRDFTDLINEFFCTRKSTQSLFKSFSEEMMLKIGSANESEFTVRALGFIIIGHQKHHLQVIEERYL